MWPGLKSNIKKKKKSATKYKKKKDSNRDTKSHYPTKLWVVLPFKDYGFEIFKKNCQLSRSKENMAIKDAKGNTNQ